jgi:thiamine biosynthesis lipoprotein ApbE
MGEKGIEFIEKQRNLEAYMIKNNQIAVMTSGFEKYCV